MQLRELAPSADICFTFLHLQVESQLEKVKAELEVQSQHTARLESSCRALERSLSQSGKRLQVSRSKTTLKKNPV